MSIKTAFGILRDDIRAIFANDPAARSIAEVLLYPGLHAIMLHRVAHAFWGWRTPFVPRLISQIARFWTGVEIHPGATIGRGFFIDHGMGVVIGETAEIGDWVMLYQNVTLGGTGKQRGKRHPTLEDRVVVGVGAIVLGAITIGKGAKVGGGAVVVKDVPPHSTAVGVPARVVATRNPSTGESQRVEQLPDPEGVMLRCLRDKVLQLETRLAEIEHQTNHHVEHHRAFSDVPPSLWASLDESGPGRRNTYDEEFLSGSGI